MRLWSSFRFRLLVGSLLWTGGLLYIAHLLSALVLVGPRAFRGFEPLWLILALSIAFMLSGMLLVRNGLSSFRRLRSGLSAIHQGHDRQVRGVYPTEVQPLVDDLNALLSHRDARVREALNKAGDLAHGLKTPLAVLAHEAGRARAAGLDELAARLDEQIDRMRRQLDYHLAQARAAASGAAPGTRASVRASADGLARALARLHAARGVAIDVAVPDGHAVRVQREDLDELLGNLLDNACKWTRTRVAVTSSRRGDRVVIDVDDDGPGLPAAQRAAVLGRGVRADEGAPGSGLGLAIVRDLAGLYGGSVELLDSPLGGLRARLDLPLA